MKRMFGILALMVIASIMIAGCVQPAGNETVTPGTTPEATGTPMGTVTTAETGTPMGTVTTAETGTPMGTVTTAETGTTPTTPAANATETPPRPPAAVLADELVSITDSGFVPSTITVPTGTTVGWTNDGEMNQTVTGTGANGFFDSGLLQPGDSFTYNFRGTGNYTYTSQTSGSSGVVIVTANTST
ncbi:MAG: hypothetical protein PHT97_10255 [Methanoculleus sp.]|uniref:cupredoxin domain-containing protein n=1 Tax=Methanoculleus sp. TaxID=90427 RepID=UPI0025E888E6|nr:hypothetical protein [Methanoculleus sp.]MCK9318748.1 hypothetical protein [Methanoculleus sp.]MDD3216832.1 hypothetical protein [Methanoculleus sp.]MDD4471521.1 hypothetical protein [Methanoculleus sp.]